MEPKQQNSTLSAFDISVIAVFLVLVFFIIIVTKDDNNVNSTITSELNQTIKKDSNTSDNISLELQKSIEQVLATYKTKLGADEIIVSVMESNTGNILSLATSNSMELNSSNNAVSFVYEPGSVIKPLVIALALDKNRASLQEEFPAYNNGTKDKNGEFPKGVIQIDRWKISDHYQIKKNTLTIEDIIVNSSNIGAIQLANRLSGKELLDGLHQFGIAQKTGIDLPNEKTGTLPTLAQLSSGEQLGKLNIFKSTISNGHGITTTFMELLKGYNLFNNDGNSIAPSIGKKSFQNPPYKVLSTKSASMMKQLLIKNVLIGTGKNALFDGLEIGGKTGTANITVNGEYQNKYISSFFGFANDSNSKYTIGVMVNNPNSKGEHWNYYYAENSAVPIFREVVSLLAKDGFLQPNSLKK